jgi:hypothetical protein
MIKNKQSTALILTIWLTVTSLYGANYNGDLLVGFTDAVSKDLIYDLGRAGSITNGQQWDLSALLTSFNLPGVSWGVVGTANLPSGRTSWVTSSLGAPNAVPNNSLWVRINTALEALYLAFTNAGSGQSTTISPLDDNSWNQQTINGTLFTQYHNVYQDPNSVGITCAGLYSAISSNLPPTLIGNFCLGANGVLTFTTSSPTPPAPDLQIARAGNVSTISFVTTNGVNYTLLYTNTAGLGTPVANWPSLPGTISGNNSTTNFTDTSADPDRVYRVKAQ